MNAVTYLACLLMHTVTRWPLTWKHDENLKHSSSGRLNLSRCLLWRSAGDRSVQVTFLSHSSLSSLRCVTLQACLIHRRITDGERVTCCLDSDFNLVQRQTLTVASDWVWLLIDVKIQPKKTIEQMLQTTELCSFQQKTEPMVIMETLISIVCVSDCYNGNTNTQ